MVKEPDLVKSAEQTKFLRHMIFGKMTETLIEQILKSRFYVYHFGYELITENISQIARDKNKQINYDKRTEADRMIEVSPDFLITAKNDEQGKLYFIEVKTTRGETLMAEFNQYHHNSRRWYKCLQAIKYYPSLRIVNVIWDCKKPDIKVYSGKLSEDGKDFSLIEEKTGDLFNDKDLDIIFEVIRNMKPPQK